VPAPSSGYLQFIRHNTLIGIATEKGAVIRLLHRPGHFVVAGQPMATVWPPDCAPAVSDALRRAHITGPYRTLTQDLAFAVDQLVEIGIRALSPEAICSAATVSGAGSIASVASTAPRLPLPPQSSDEGRTHQATCCASGRVVRYAVTRARRPSIQAGAVTASAFCFG